MEKHYLTEAGTVVNLFMVFQFLKRLTTPFENTDAFKLGIIDKDGKRTDKKMKTTAEKESWSMFERLVFRLKMLLGKIPGGKSRIASYAAALMLIKENEKWTLGAFGVDGDEVDYRLYEHVEELKGTTTFEFLEEHITFLKEDGGANAVGGGGVAGINPGEDPPVGKKRKKKKVIDNPKAIGRKTFGQFMEANYGTDTIVEK